MACFGFENLDKRFNHISAVHPCFSGEANMTNGRIHLPVSPACNIQCRFCKRTFNKTEQRPGVTASIVTPEDAVDIVSRAVKLSPDITVAGIAGPGDTLATFHAIKTFKYIHKVFPSIINCLSTNGLLLERYTEELAEAGVRTITVTVNAVDPVVLDKICSLVIFDGKKYKGIEGAKILINAQKRGIQKAALEGFLIKINIVLIPSINGYHIEKIAETVKDLGAGIVNIIPLIPQHEFSGFKDPSCAEISAAREAAEKHLAVFRHCKHCRADACGIPGKTDISDLLYKYSAVEQTFSHG
jgi:nitrogen fixation protein NifB